MKKHKKIKAWAVVNQRGSITYTLSSVDREYPVVGKSLRVSPAVYTMKKYATALSYKVIGSKVVRCEIKLL
jgi:hypothetical protein